jgi:Zn-finger nucleic acid-binding protein
MRTYERSGITVDQCTECRGIFLDRGELDRLVDAENAWHVQSPPPVSYSGYGAAGAPRRHRRKSFLEELFD